MPLPRETAIRLLRAKKAELEAYVKQQEAPDWLAADIALIAGLLADVLEHLGLLADVLEERNASS
jgi:hypothetical protein